MQNHPVNLMYFSLTGFPNIRKLLILFLGTLLLSSEGWAIVFSVAGKPQSVTLSDFNEDGSLDLVVAISGTNVVTLFENDGQGEFDLLATLAVGEKPKDLAAVDLNGDGLLDLVAVDSRSNQVSLLFNDGRGSFEAARVFSVGSKPLAVDTDDLNGDGVVSDDEIKKATEILEKAKKESGIKEKKKLFLKNMEDMI